MAKNLWVGIADDNGIESFLLVKDHLSAIGDGDYPLMVGKGRALS